MRIVKGTESITIPHPVFLIFGQPGIGKSSLGYSTDDPLLLDFDQGAHRAANRRDTLAIATWADVAELMESPDALAPYQSITVDTVGRCLDLITADIIADNPKLGRDGNLTQQGYGVLKNRFRTWITMLRGLGKDVLLIAHQKEEKDGEVTVVRPDIIGGSFGEVMKTSDFVGFVYMRGRDRVLDFSPTDRWVGKNPAQWKPITIPPIEKAGSLMAGLYDQGREALGLISRESAAITSQVDEWRTAVQAYTTTDEFKKAITELQTSTLVPIALAQVKKLIADRAKALQFQWDAKAKSYRQPEPVGQ